jgi:hypothetical protein
VLRNERRLGSWGLHRAAEQLAANFKAERIALAITAALQTPQISALQDVLGRLTCKEAK